MNDKQERAIEIVFVPTDTEPNLDAIARTIADAIIKGVATDDRKEVC